MLRQLGYDFKLGFPEEYKLLVEMKLVTIILMIHCLNDSIFTIKTIENNILNRKINKKEREILIGAFIEIALNTLAFLVFLYYLLRN